MNENHQDPQISRIKFFCFSCDQNPFCTWFTYDAQSALCYLKDRRGYLVNKNRTEGERFTSGATFRGRLVLSHWSTSVQILGSDWLINKLGHIGSSCFFCA